MRSPIKLLKRRRIIEWGISSGIILIVAITIIANYTVEHKTDTLIYKDAATIPCNKTGLLLGTSKTLRSGAVLPISTFKTGYRLLLLFLKPER